MFRKTLLVSAALVLSTTGVFAGSNAPQPGGKGMHNMMGGAGSLQTHAMSKCDAKGAGQTGAVGRTPERMMASGKDAQRMMGRSSLCSEPMGAPAGQLQMAPYTKR